VRIFSIFNDVFSYPRARLPTGRRCSQRSKHSVAGDVDGPNLAAKILTTHPNAKVIFMSGYGLETHDAESLTEVGFLPKPFNSRMLFDAIERAFAALQTSLALSSTSF
jgi:DNA-binding NtrC family response regulator